MTSKPEGPIWIDMADALADVSVRQLIAIANLALNRLDMRAIGEICGEVGLRPELRLVDKEPTDDRAMEGRDG